MLDAFVDSVLELADTIRTNPLRTALTALSVTWGIFMLVLLLAAGQGLQNGIEKDFEDDAVNSIWIWPGVTGEPHAGHGVGRQVHLTNSDVDVLAREVAGLQHITARYNLWGEYTVSWGTRRASFDVRASHPDHLHLEKTIITKGRFLNELDQQARRKVAVIGTAVARPLFGEHEPVGEEIDINGVVYRVVGVFRDEGGDRELRKIYIPISTAQLVYGGKDRVHQIMFTLDDAHAARADVIADDVLRLLARRHEFSPTDEAALFVRNRLENYRRVMGLFRWIRLFVWIVGIGTVIAGLVGVSNIMLIAVKERTREIGLRKALGAPPHTIVLSIVQEALLITGASGYVGLVLGVGLVETVAALMPPNDFLRDPEVNLSAAIGATLLLMLTGALAGLIPARRAAMVSPVAALRNE